MGSVDLLGWVDLCWRITPVEPPHVIRRCTHCNAPRRFVSTGKFRLNAQQRRIDVWLLYRCVACDATWKHALFERRLPEEIGADLYARLLRNDAQTARRHAFDVARLRGAGRTVETDDALRIESSPTGPAESGAGWRVTLDVPDSCDVRLDRILMQALRVSRTQLQRWAADGSLHVPEPPRALRRPARHLQVVFIHADAVREIRGR